MDYDFSRFHSLLLPTKKGVETQPSTGDILCRTCTFRCKLQETKIDKVPGLNTRPIQLKINHP